MTITLLQDKRILLGVTGSIACYKAVDLASKLTQAGALVDVIMTDAARRFVSPLTFRSVTGREVYDDMWSTAHHIQQVQLGESADLMIIAPATANTLAGLAMGSADNLLTLTALAARCPLMVAPAMDGGMYAHPAVQANVMTLEQRGVFIVGPAEGRMASGLVGVGRLPETSELMGEIRLVLGRGGPLAGRHVVISAGPTRERIDPVRFLSNRSSGKQGVALAQAALDLGAHVTLIAGPITEPPPYGVDVVLVESALAMHDAVLSRLHDTHMLIMAAAVADFRPEKPSDQKIKKTLFGDKAPEIPLVRNLDILMAVRTWREAVRRRMVVVGFAAETQDVVAHGRDKLARKGLDFIAINDVSGTQTGFNVTTNQVTLLGKAGDHVDIPLADKSVVAENILNAIIASPSWPFRDDEPGG